MVVAIARLDLHISHSRSLKDKRRVVRSIVDKTMAAHRVKLSEVGGQDTWQRAVLGFAVVSGDRSVAESVVDKIVRSIEDVGDAELRGDDRETIYFGDEGAYE